MKYISLLILFESEATLIYPVYLNNILVCVQCGLLSTDKE